MEASSFTVDPDHNKKIVRIKLSGQLAVSELPRLFEAERAAVASMGGKMGQHLLLIDARNLDVQTQAVVQAMQQLLSTHDAARRTAVLVGGALLKLQTKRVIAGTSHQTFENMAEAEQWLVSD